MKAWAYTARGTPNQVLKLRDDIPQPQTSDLKAGDVLIKVSHVALFAPQVKIMIVAPHLNSNPRFPEFGFSGTVIAVAASASDGIETRFNPGDAVFGMLDPRQAKNYNGALAEYIIMPQSNVLHRPSHIKPEQAVGLGGTGCTNIQFAEVSGLLKIERSADGKGERIVSTGRGKRVLVTAGSSGTGNVTVQLAKMLVGEEGRVVATCSERNAQAVKELGADEIIDYTKHKHLHTYLISQYCREPFDLIVDVAGTDSQLFAESPAYLRESGTFIFAGNMPVTFSKSDNVNIAALIFIWQVLAWLLWILLNRIRPVFLGGVPRRGIFHSGRINERYLKLVEQLVEDGNLKGLTDSVWPMKDVLKAYERVLSGRARGRVVINVQE